METLKQEVEKTVRRFYGFGSNIAISNVEATFTVATQSNGALPIVQTNPIEKRTYKKRLVESTSPSKSLHREYTTSAEDIAVMRNFFAKWAKEERLTPDQMEIVNKTKGIHYPVLTDNTKLEMLRLFELIRDKKLFTKENTDA